MTQSGLTYNERKHLIDTHLGNFPMRIVFYLERKKSGRFNIFFLRSRSKIQLQNYKLSSLYRITLNSVVTTPLEVVEISSFDSFEAYLDELTDLWCEPVVNTREGALNGSEVSEPHEDLNDLGAFEPHDALNDLGASTLEPIEEYKGDLY